MMLPHGYQQAAVNAKKCGSMPNGNIFVGWGHFQRPFIFLHLNMNLLHCIAFPSLLLTAPLSVTAQTAVNEYVPGITPEGITYFLPETHVRFVLTATRHLHTPGEYAQYAERYMGIADVPTEAYEEWTLDSVEMLPYGIPASSKAYTIALNPKSSAPLVSLTPEGILLAVNEEAEQPDELPEAGCVPLPSPDIRENNYLSADILRASTRSKKAELIAQEIYDIRENRSLLAKGQADFNPSDGNQLKTMLLTLSESEQALTSFFTGKATAERHTFVVDFCPKESTEPTLFFRFSKYLGLVDNDDLAGEPYYIAVTDESRLPETVDDGKNGKKKEKPDLRYCVPGRARITLSSTTQKITEAVIAVAQMGRIEHLGGELFNKKFSTHVLLNPVTGNIERISMDEDKE